MFQKLWRTSSQFHGFDPWESVISNLVLQMILAKDNCHFVCLELMH